MSNVNQRELSEILGISTVTLTEWQKVGMPMDPRTANGLENRYDTAAVIGWMTNRAVEKVRGESSRDRLDRVRADREELGLRRELNEVVEVTTIAPALDDFFADVVSELDSMPNRYTDLMDGSHDRSERYQLFRRIAREIRERLSRFEFRTSISAQLHPELETSARDQSSRVGGEASAAQ